LLNFTDLKIILLEP